MMAAMTVGGPEQIALALGSNMGDRKGALLSAVAALRSFVTINAVSPLYETTAAYVTDQPSFLNAALIGEMNLEPLALLWNVKQIETEIGREPAFRYGPRLIDIDILFYGDLVYATPELHLPHPRIAERDFVLRPLAAIAPSWRHPLTNLTVIDMLACVPDTKPSCLGSLVA